MPDASSPVPLTKDDPRYIQATIDQLPGLGDSRERRIIEVMKEEILVTDASKETFSQLEDDVKSNWQKAYDRLGDPVVVRRIFQEGTQSSAKIAKVNIEEGEELVKSLNPKNPLMIVSNHLGTFKLISMLPEELKQRGVAGQQLPSIYYPFVTYYMPFQPIAERIGNGIYEASFEQPGKLGQLFREAGNIDVPPQPFAQDRVDTLTNDTKDLISNAPNSALVVFPEGGTTGKRSNGRIYNLEKFHKGAFVIAAKLGMPILPVAQYFDIQRGGFDLRIFEPFSLDQSVTVDEIDEAASNTQGKMQEWLDTKKSY